MPIFLDDLSKTITTNAPTYTPKYFSSTLTGTGKKQGLLVSSINPASTQNVHKLKPINNIDTVMSKRKYYVNGKQIQDIPFYFVKNTYMGECSLLDKVYMPPTNDMCLIATANNKIKLHYYLHMEPYCFTLETDNSDPNMKAKKRHQIYYYVRLIRVQENARSDKWRTYKIDDSLLPQCNNMLSQELTMCPYATVTTILDRLSNLTSVTVNEPAAIAYLDNYSLYDAICKCSELWQTKASDIITNTIKILLNHGQTDHIINMICDILHHIETYPIPLDQYKNIYKYLESNVTSDNLKIFCNQNMNLLLHKTIFTLDANKPQLEKLPVPQTKPTLNPKLSVEQKKAIATEEPLVLVQAGAGTGKSTVIINRIKYMLDCGVDPNDITVLSFTNAAADHIKELNDNVNSMTIASMIHSIYTLNFKEHTLSANRTIINSIDIFCQNWPYGSDFKNALYALEMKRPGAFTNLNNFVEENKEDVIDILNEINQTSLELEIILCYQNLDDLQEPDDIKSKYLIVDEVQDNSIFEFIFTLMYVNKHKESLFWVGDCSQTLYEFRAANPKALNALEASNVFTAYQLQTNYRSNQEILDFANVALADIEANQYANIRLQANNLSPVTYDSFKEKVQVHYEPIKKTSEIDQVVTDMFTSKIRNYLDDKFNKKEQVVFLAHKHKHVNLMHTLLEKLYPTASIADITSKRSYNSTFFSSYVTTSQTDMNLFSINCFIDMLFTDMNNKIPHIMRCKQGSAQEHSTQITIQKWLSKNKPVIQNWQTQVQNNVLSHDDFIANVKNNLIKYEIDLNAIRQTLTNEKNRQNKENQNTDTADFIVSTIHGAKGLEFKHAVIFYEASNRMSEERKRMYYVAFTRPQETECILAVDTVKNPKITGDYDTILEQLKQRELTNAIQN